MTPTCRFKWTRPFGRKDEICFMRVCHHISDAVYFGTDFYTHCQRKILVIASLLPGYYIVTA
jgi:hypothetical protein